MLLLLAASLFAEAGPVRAQATADQLNKLSLEALTAPSAGGGGGGYGRSYWGHAARRSYARSPRRAGYSRNSYGRHSYRQAPSRGYRAAVGSRHRTAARHAFGRSYRRTYRAHGHVAPRHRYARRRA